jgi:glycosyltransferase involved in cell wall biosynthesis
MKTMSARQRCAWLVNPFDPTPGTATRPMRYAGFAEALAADGWDVVWFTTDFDHQSRRMRVPVTVDRMHPNPRLRLEYIHVSPYQATVGPARLLSHRRYARGLAMRMEAEPSPPRVVLASIPLLGALEACLAYRARFGGAVVADVQDTWPEALTSALPPASRPMYFALKASLVRRERRRLAACDGMIAVSETYLRMRAPVAMPQLPAFLGIDLASFDGAWRVAGVRRPSPRDGMTFLWTGSVRPATDIRTVLRAAAIVRHSGLPARFIIAGDGPSRANLEALARGSGLDNDVVRFTGAFTEEMHARLSAESHVGLNAYAAGAVNSLTNKLFDYQAGRLAILNSLPGEPADLIRQHGMGRNYAAGDAHSLAAEMSWFVKHPDQTAAMGRAARRFVEAHGCRARIARRVVQFLNAVAADGETAAWRRQA